MPKHTQFQKNEDKLINPVANKVSLGNIVRIVLFESNPIKAQLKGALFGGTILWLFLKQDPIPLIVYFIVSLVWNAVAILFWRTQMKKSKAKMEQVEKEIQTLNAQIKEKRATFEKMREDLINKN
jgi:translation initiation factor 2B subunit (eIF-2B alpha/beta/delta family)